MKFIKHWHKYTQPATSIFQNIVSALKTGFFKGEYEEPFPMLKAYDSEQNETVVDFGADIYKQPYI